MSNEERKAMHLERLSVVATDIAQEKVANQNID